jgi:type IV secretory pathway VirB9-like protein
MNPQSKFHTTTGGQASMTQGRVAQAAAVLLMATAGCAALAQNTPFDNAMQAQRAAPAAPAAAPSPAARPAPAPAAPMAPAATPQAAAQPMVTAPNDGAPPAAAPRPRPHAAHAAPRPLARAANQSYGGEPALSCRNINWKKGDIIRIQAQPYKQIHIALPENGIDVIMGDKELWALDWINNRIFLKPTSRSNEGRSTTISAIGQSGNAYEFVVNRIADSAEVSHCVYISSEGSGMISRAAWSRPTDREAEITTVLGREIANLRESNENLARAATEGAVQARKKVNTGYEWKTGMFSRWGGAEVESVHDDGRFTYVRLKSDMQGLLAVSAEIDGKPQLLEYGYDAPSRTYQISGIFPKLVLRSGEQSMTVTRKNS